MNTDFLNVTQSVLPRITDRKHNRGLKIQFSLRNTTSMGFPSDITILTYRRCSENVTVVVLDISHREKGERRRSTEGMEKWNSLLTWPSSASGWCLHPGGMSLCDTHHWWRMQTTFTKTKTRTSFQHLCKPFVLAENIHVIYQRLLVMIS